MSSRAKPAPGLLPCKFQCSEQQAAHGRQACLRPLPMGYLDWAARLPGMSYVC
jgi:hypothetical protein